MKKSLIETAGQGQTNTDLAATIIVTAAIIATLVYIIL